MDKVAIGVLITIGIFHALLVMVPVVDTLRANISRKSRLVWCLFLLLLPFLGVAVFHYRFRSSLFQGKPYNPSSNDLGGPPSGFSRLDKD